MKTVLTPAETQLLGLSDTDLQALSYPATPHTRQTLEKSIQDIIAAAYQRVPAFKALVAEDQRRDPKNLQRTAKLISKFLGHLKDVLPPAQTTWIDPDDYRQAYDMAESAIKAVQPAAAPVEERQFPPAAPLSDAELAMFGLRRSQITPEFRGSDMDDYMAYFFGKKKSADGKAVKNEATAKMPDELRHTYVFRLLREIRDLKIARSGQLTPKEQEWLGKDLTQLDRMVDLRVQGARSQSKEKEQKTNDIRHINQVVSEILPLVSRVETLLTKEDLRNDLARLGDLIDSALPSTDLITDRLQAIQAAVDALGLSKNQIAFLLKIEPGSYSQATSSVSDRVNDLNKDLEDLNKKIKETGESPELVSQRRALEQTIKSMTELSGKDLGPLQGAVSAYLDTLLTYRDAAEKNLSVDVGSTVGDFKELSGFVAELSRQFNTLAPEVLFKRRWEGRVAPLFSTPGTAPQSAPAAPAEAPATPPATPKTAAATAESYAKKLEEFKAGGVRKSIDDLLEIVDNTDTGLSFLRRKLQSILETQPEYMSENEFNKETGKFDGPKTIGEDFTNNPLGQRGPDAGPSIEDMNKTLKKMRSLIDKLDLSKKKEKAIGILQDMTDLPSAIHASKKKAVQASVVDFLRRVAARIMSGATANPPSAPTHGYAPGSKPNPGQGRPSGKARLLVYRDTITKNGKKALEGFYHDTPFIADFVDELERAGLGDRLLTGDKVPEIDIEPLVERVLQKTTGTKGSLDNLIGTQALREKGTKYEIAKKIKDIDEAGDRVVRLNQSIRDLNKRYLPVLGQLAEFLANPLENIRHRLETAQPAAAQAPAKAVSPEKAEPVQVSKANYQVALKSLLTKYHRSVKDKTAAEVMPLPTDEYRRIYSITQDLADIKQAIEADKKKLEDEKKTVGSGKDSAKINNLRKDIALKVKKYLETSLESLQKSKDYLRGYDSTIQADQETISNLEAYLSSEEAQKDSDAKKAQDQLKILKDNFDHEQRIYKHISDAVKKAEDKIEKNNTKQYLKDLTDDLKDNMVEQLYSIATAPEMNPSKEDAQTIKERAKEHERGLSYIIDRDTYKKNMNRIMLYKPSAKKAPEGWEKEWKDIVDSKTTALPSDRLMATREKVKDLRKQHDHMFQSLKDPASWKKYLTQQLQEWAVKKRTLTDYIESIRDSLTADEKAVKENEDFLTKLSDTNDAQLTEGLSQDEAAKINEQQVAIDKSQETLAVVKKHLNDQIIALKDLEEKAIPELEKDIEYYKHELDDVAGGQSGPSVDHMTISELGEKIKVLKDKIDPESARSFIKALNVLWDKAGDANVGGKHETYDDSWKAVLNVYRKGILSDIKDFKKKRTDKSIMSPEDKAELNKLEAELTQLQDKVKKDEAMSSGRYQAPLTPQKMRERLMQLRTELMSISTRANLPPTQRVKRREELEKEISELAARVGEPVGKDVSHNVKEVKNPDPADQGIPHPGTGPGWNDPTQTVDIDRMNPSLMRKRLVQLKQMHQKIMTKKDLAPDERTKQRNKIKEEIDNLTVRLREMSSMPKTAAIEDTREPMTEFERALEERGTKPAPFMKELPKPKGWEVVENFLDESIKERELLEQAQTREKLWESEEEESESRKHISERLTQLKKVIPIIDAYRNQIIQISTATKDNPDKAPLMIPLRDTVKRFDDLMYEYQDYLVQYINQREDAQNRWNKLEREVGYLKSMYDSETGEFTGLRKEELDNLKGVFFKILYKYLDTYWSSRVGKNINVFGERDNNWYNNVYRTFKNLGATRSNKKLMTLLNKYKEGTQSEFPKDVTIRLSRIKALEDRIANIYRGYKDQGLDVQRNPEYQDLTTRLNNLKAQANQIDVVFRNMAGTVLTDIHANAEKSVKDKIPEDKPASDTKLDEKASEYVDTTRASLEPALQAVSDEDTINKAEQVAAMLENKIGIQPPSPEAPAAATPKTAYDRSHRDFDLKILYGSVMQRKIAEMILRK
jgi:hypothetical protein